MRPLPLPYIEYGDPTVCGRHDGVMVSVPDTGSSGAGLSSATERSVMSPPKCGIGTCKFNVGDNSVME